MKKGTMVKYRAGEKEVLAIVRTAHRDGSCTVEARYFLEGGKQVGGYLGYRYRQSRHRLLAA